VRVKSTHRYSVLDNVGGVFGGLKWGSAAVPNRKGSLVLTGRDFGKNGIALGGAVSDGSPTERIIDAHLWGGPPGACVNTTALYAGKGVSHQDSRGPYWRNMLRNEVRSRK